ncbi:TetR/AcrR family transcriptional regulator [Phenylobacterium sp.]|uniref:TetR/AcrR family transcriptional regulator n=1 Tax=Phenylobacterium sp. TaxID=1871053 RepID=UPI002733A122|nr:TetR/AcrR family transcriptional regulator [Phenylobacterium sp.]MDP3853317.1 TetR/AcrR family transcriptional regulator [Phenylobacterium sp.]
MSVTRRMGRNDREKSADRREAAGSTGDRRALRTRTALHRALIGLIVERDYDEISIADITEAADVGRSTFYAHFTDKDDLLRRGLGHLRGHLLEARDSAGGGEGAASRTLWFSRFMTEHLKEQHQLYRALMRGRAGPIIIDKIKELLSELVRTELAARENGSGAQAAPPEIAVRFVVGAYMSVVTWWLDRGARETPEEIDQAFRELALGGLGTLLRS